MTSLHLQHRQTISSGSSQDPLVPYPSPPQVHRVLPAYLATAANTATVLAASADLCRNVSSTGCEYRDFLIDHDSGPTYRHPIEQTLRISGLDDGSPSHPHPPQTLPTKPALVCVIAFGASIH